MISKIYRTKSGDIHYWVSKIDKNKPTLVFLPGLTANHHLFDPQLKYFNDKYNLLVWDPPGHSKSRPFKFNFSLSDKAEWLNSIINKEGLEKPVLIGQSMGGYIAQEFISLFPGKAKGFISIDSSSLSKEFYSKFELSLLDKTEPIYRLFPYKLLLKLGPINCSTTPYGQNLMTEMMRDYENDIDNYYRLVGEGYKILKEGIVNYKDNKIDCPVLLICGSRDRAGSVKKYNRKWNKETGFPLFWIKGAGHNSNTDKPDEVNSIIGLFVKLKVELGF